MLISFGTVVVEVLSVNTVPPGVPAVAAELAYPLATVMLGPVALAPVVVTILAVVVEVVLPLATYKFLANGVGIPNCVYVLDAGAKNWPPAVPVRKVSVFGYISPLNRATVAVNVHTVPDT